jgi:hypothetical protein
VAGQSCLPARLVEVLAHLHRNAAVKLQRLQQRLQVLGHEVAPERRQFVGHPRVFGGIVLPEMLVRVDFSFGPGGVYRRWHPSQL